PHRPPLHPPAFPTRRSSDLLPVSTPLLALAVFGLLARARAAPVPSGSAELTMAVQRLQKTPDDQALRTRIIELARKLKPAPAIPDRKSTRLNSSHVAISYAV